MKAPLALALLGLSVAPVCIAQTPSANPIVSSAREIVSREGKFISAAAEQMPAGKYSYHPTPDQWTFGKITSHVALANNAVCAMLAGTPPPQVTKVSESDSKETIVAAVNASVAFCDTTLAKLQDSSLGDTITFFRGAQKPRARALFELVGDLEDHYSQMAAYLRANGMTPPSAKPKQ